MLSWDSAAGNKPLSTAVKLGLERRRISGCSWRARLDVDMGAAHEKVAVGAVVELLLDLVCRSRRATLD